MRVCVEREREREKERCIKEKNVRRYMLRQTDVNTHTHTHTQREGERERERERFARVFLLHTCTGAPNASYMSAYGGIYERNALKEAVARGLPELNLS